MKIVADYGPIFIISELRFNPLLKKTLTAFSYKHCVYIIVNNQPVLSLERDANGHLIKDFSKPIARINWKDGSTKIIDQDIWDHLPEDARNYIQQTFNLFWQSHH